MRIESRRPSPSGESTCWSTPRISRPGDSVSTRIVRGITTVRFASRRCTRSWYTPSGTNSPASLRPSQRTRTRPFSSSRSLARFRTGSPAARMSRSRRSSRRRRIDSLASSVRHPQPGEKTSSSRLDEIGEGSSLRDSVIVNAAAVPPTSARTSTVTATRRTAADSRLSAWEGLLLPVGGDQDLGDLGPGELRRRELAGREQLAHLRPGEEDVVIAPVRAGLGRRHLAAGPAPEGVLEEHRLDVELVRLELVEDELGVVGAVVVADAGVVSADDEVRAAVVLAADRVPDRLPRAGVAHRGREGGDDDPVAGVVVVDEDAVAVDAR